MSNNRYKVKDLKNLVKGLQDNDWVDIGQPPYHTLNPSFHGDIHSWFGLSYSNYLVLHRSIMSDMPADWQNRMIVLLEEINRFFDTSKFPTDFMVKAKKNGKFTKDPLANYRHVNLTPYRIKNPKAPWE